MNNIVPPDTFWDFKPVSVGPYRFDDFVRTKPFPYEGRMIPSFHLKVPSINQYPIVDVELSCFLDVKGTSFVVDVFEGIVYLVVHCCHAI